MVRQHTCHSHHRSCRDALCHSLGNPVCAGHCFCSHTLQKQHLRHRLQSHQPHLWAIPQKSICRWLWSRTLHPIRLQTGAPHQMRPHGMPHRPLLHQTRPHRHPNQRVGPHHLPPASKGASHAPASHPPTSHPPTSHPPPATTPPPPESAAPRSGQSQLPSHHPLS